MAAARTVPPSQYACLLVFTIGDDDGTTLATVAVGWDGGDIFDATDAHSSTGQGSQCALCTGPGVFGPVPPWP